MQQLIYNLLKEPIKEEITNANNETSPLDCKNLPIRNSRALNCYTDEENEERALKDQVLTPRILSSDDFHFDKQQENQWTEDSISRQSLTSPSSCSSSLYKQDTHNNSILAQNALKASRKQKKRHFSMTVLPRHNTPSISESSNKKKSRRKYYSLQPISQYEKNKLASLGNDDEVNVQWDPHIDAFEILRAKITGITRSMQQFHVQELFQDELLAEERRKRISILPNTTLSTPLNSKTVKTTSRRLSLANLSTPTANASHRRIRSQSFIPYDRGFEEEKKFLHNLIRHEDKPQEEEEEEDRLLTSPNLTALFLTTNNLISSRLDELSETASIQSSDDQLSWQKQFLDLVTRCIQQSEALESLSTELLNAEHRVRELMLIKDTLHEQFGEREKQYEERIRECQDIAQQQLMMIDSLEELDADIDMKLETTRREAFRQEALRALDGHRQAQDEETKRWDFRKSVADLLHMNEKQDMIHKIRWEIGMFVGGGVGTGHIIHAFEDKLNGIDMMIAGTGSTSTSPGDFLSQQMSLDDDDNEENDSVNHEHSVTISSNIQHIGLYQHNYIIHLNNQDRRTRFLLLPRTLWVPDETTNQCQFHTRKKRCSTFFTFFDRRHHCRKCGLLICQRHSANRLPLFHPSKIYSTTGQWSRVCDTCFYELIIHK